MTFTIGRRGLFIAATIAVLALGAGVGYASIPDAGGVIHACYDSKSLLRVIDVQAGDACKKGETPLSWSQTGPQGPPGQNGTNGTNGTNGVSGYERVTGNNATLNQTTGGASSVALCPAGKKVIGGGYQSNGGGAGTGSSAYAITQNYPSTSNPKDGSPPIDSWSVTAEVTSPATIPANYSFYAIAICANVT